MTPDNTEAIKGRFQKGQSGNPAGRPKGSLNQASIIVRELMADEAESITRKLIELAKNGELAAIKLIIERLVPPIKELHLAQEQQAEKISPASSRLKELIAEMEQKRSDKPDVSFSFMVCPKIDQRILYPYISKPNFWLRRYQNFLPDGQLSKFDQYTCLLRQENPEACY